MISRIHPLNLFFTQKPALKPNSAGVFSHINYLETEIVSKFSALQAETVTIPFAT